MIDSMDQCKFIYPRAGPLFRSKELSTMIRPKAHITGILCHGFFFMISVSAQDLRKDSSTMCELLSHCLTVLVDDFSVDLSRATVYIQSDNTPRECKNNILLQWLGKLVANGASTKTSGSLEIFLVGSGTDSFHRSFPCQLHSACRAGACVSSCLCVKELRSRRVFSAFGRGIRMKIWTRCLASWPNTWSGREARQWSRAILLH